jgi:hypothetical protein
MPQPFIFISYLILFCWLTIRVPFLRKTGIPVKWMALFFLAKVGVSCLYGYIHTLQPQYAGRMDTWRFFYESLEELKVLKKNPAGFLADLFRDPYQSGFHRIFSTRGSYWNDLKNTVMVKMVTVFDLFSFSNYYTNTIFYCFITLFGPAALYRTFLEKFPTKRVALLLACFCVPSFFFWGSGLHKEGLLMLGLGLFLYHARKLMDGKDRIPAILICLVSIFSIFVLRINILLAWVPAAMAWWWSERKGSHGVAIFVFVHFIFLTLFFTLPHLFPRIDLPMSMHIRQQEFIALGGRMALPVDELKPDLQGFIHNLPAAFSISFLHPFPGEGGMFYLPFTMEIMLLMVMMFLTLFFPDRRSLQAPLLLFSLTFAVSLLLTIGYIVPNVGAVIRYRSIGLTFLFLFAALGTDWERVRRNFQTNTH